MELYSHFFFAWHSDFLPKPDFQWLMNFTYGLIFDWVYDVLIPKCLLNSSYVLKYCVGAGDAVVGKSEMSYLFL